MRTRTEIELELAKLEDDERLRCDAVSVGANAPLALDQVGLKCCASTLRWVLGLPMREYHKR